MPEYDEILEQEAREQLQDMGFDEVSVESHLAEMRETGMFHND